VTWRIEPGTETPLGATWDGAGVSFALFSEHATAVELCLFDAPDAAAESARIALPERSGDVFHGRVPDLCPGQLYGYRVHGPFAARDGHRFNPHKLLVDPYARAIAGKLRFDDALRGHDPLQPELPDARDSAPFMPKCVVVDPRFDWGDDRPPRTPWSRSVLYECHVKGMTQRHPEVAESQRGRYLGLAAEPVVLHLQRLGVTAISLLPIHHSSIDAHLAGLGLPNYWGYNTLGFFAPDSRFASGDAGAQVIECKQMVKALHRAGIEVILDVVYNHTPEGGPLGPTLSLRGIDNASYYRLHLEDASECIDYTGCGNTLDTRHPRVLQLVLDSLRSWVTEYHVDGFRFDLAPALARDPVAFQRGARFFEIVRQDPVLSQVKLIAEPWDLGPDGYLQGGFPRGFAEWNGRYRDAMRRFWRGDAGQLAEVATRLAGSSDLLALSGRPPQASINFVVCHDGMTLADLVSYSQKHNLANGEEGRDGPHDDSHNWGEEGPSSALRVRRKRDRARRNLIATLAFSQGVPMLSHGDELGRSQLGNSNGYCQDNEITWVDWNLDHEGRAFLDFVRTVFALRRDNAAFRRRRFFRGESVDPSGTGDVTWLRPDGSVTTLAHWENPDRKSIAMLIPREAADACDEAGREQSAETVLLILNGHAQKRSYSLPDLGRPGSWHEVVNTARATQRRIDDGQLKVAPWSLVLLGFREQR
jgi:glycogen operon protein